MLLIRHWLIKICPLMFLVGSTASAGSYLGAQLGFGLARFHADEQVQVTGFADQLYKSTESTSRFFNGGVRGGYILSSTKKWSVHVGAGYYASARQSIHGSYYQTPSNPKDLTYLYRLYTDRLMLEASIYYKLSKVFALYGGVGLGAMQGQSRHLQFATIHYSGGAAVPLEAKNNKYYNFSYAGSLGVNILLDKNFYINIGVQYLNLGDVFILINQGSSGSQNFNKIKNGILSPVMAVVEVGCMF